MPSARQRWLLVLIALATRYPATRFEVVNLGIPSLNSAFVANRLERQLHQIRPQLVIVWVGINNLWNAVESMLPVVTSTLEAWHGLALAEPADHLTTSP